MSQDEEEPDHDDDDVDDDEDDDSNISPVFAGPGGVNMAPEYRGSEAVSLGIETVISSGLSAGQCWEYAINIKNNAKKRKWYFSQIIMFYVLIKAVKLTH